MPTIVTRPRVLGPGKLKRIHVVGAMVRHNKKYGRDRPCYTVKCGGRNYHCRGVVAKSLTAVQRFDKPLASGAVCWLETTGTVELLP